MGLKDRNAYAGDYDGFSVAYFDVAELRRRGMWGKPKGHPDRAKVGWYTLVPRYGRMGPFTSSRLAFQAAHDMRKSK